MKRDPRYAVSSLEPTTKERALDALERELLIEIPDDLFRNLVTKLSLPDIERLRDIVKEAKTL